MGDRIKGAAAAAMWVVVAGVAGCGGGGGAGQAAEEGAESAVEGPRSACELITVEELRAYVGDPVSVSETAREEGYSECTYTDPSGTWPYLILSVLWEDGREAMEGTMRGIGLASLLLDKAVAPNAGGDTIVRPGAVPGLGDAAYYHDMMPSYVLSGDVMLQLVVTYLPDSRRNFAPLVRTVLGRL